MGLRSFCHRVCGHSGISTAVQREQSLGPSGRGDLGPLMEWVAVREGHGPWGREDEATFRRARGSKVPCKGTASPKLKLAPRRPDPGRGECRIFWTTCVGSFLQFFTALLFKCGLTAASRVVAFQLNTSKIREGVPPYCSAPHLGSARSAPRGAFGSVRGCSGAGSRLPAARDAGPQPAACGTGEPAPDVSRAEVEEPRLAPGRAPRSASSRRGRTGRRKKGNEAVRDVNLCLLAGAR